MARALRIEFPGAVYHVTARGNARAPIFFDVADRDVFLTALGQAVSRYRWLCRAYCLMNNHYHLVLETPRPNLSLGMRWLNSTFAQAVNRRHSRQGHLLQGRYKAILVERESHLLELVRYVALNPVRAGACNRPEDWRWSSHRATAGEVAVPGFLAVDWILDHFGTERRRAQARYQAFVADGRSSDPLAQVRGSLYLGSEEFVRRHSPAGLEAPEAREIPRAQRQPLRPSLSSILRDRSVRRIRVAHCEYGYTLREIADHLRVHPATVGRQLRRLGDADV